MELNEMDKFQKFINSVTDDLFNKWKIGSLTDIEREKVRFAITDALSEGICIGGMDNDIFEQALKWNSYEH